MLTRTKVFSLTIAALLVLTLAPGAPTTAAPPEPLNILSNTEATEAHFSDFSVPSASLVVQDPLTPLSPGTTTRVSVASDGTEGNARSDWPSISADGRYVAFHSVASNLVSGDTNGYMDIFVHDQQAGQTTRVSLAYDGTQGNDTSARPSISADGRYVAFESDASNLVSGDTNNEFDVFVHDREMGQTTRVSVASDGSQMYNGSGRASISADGRYVAFNSWDVFVHDRQTGQTTCVSVASDGTQGNGRAEYLSISADGRYVAFASYASNLVSGDTNGVKDIFVHDRETGQTTRVSVASDGTQGNTGSCYPSISADGRYVVFDSGASNLVSGDTNGCADIFVHDRETGQTTRVSVASDGSQGNERSEDPSISADGRYVAFSSVASNLVSGDTNSAYDIFVHDRQMGQTTRVSVASDDSEGNYNSHQSSISAGGRYVAFLSKASNLVSGDTNGTWDIFVHDREGGSDTTPPAAIIDLAASTDTGAGEVDLTWTAPGDDGNTGTAMTYTVRYADSSIVSGFGWEGATDVDGEPTPQAAGSSESMTVSGLTPGQTYYFAIRTQDEAGNWSGLSNSPSAVAQDNTRFIDLTISLYKSVTAAEQIPYENILGFFADAVYEMSNGTHKIRNVTINQDGDSSDTAHVTWTPSEWPRANVSGYSHSGQHIWMGDSFPFANPYNALAESNQRGAGYTLAHEWGHYYYGLYDEYKANSNEHDDEPSFPHSDDEPVLNSVMHSQWSAVDGDFNWLNFSVAKNNTERTAQHRMYEASGWETLARPVSQDPRDGHRSATPVRIHYPELATVAPATNQDSSLELPTTPTETTRSELHISWADRVTRVGVAQAGFTYQATVESVLGDEINYPQPVILAASVTKVDPVAKAGITASVKAPDDTVANLNLKDDGFPPDVLADDGLYSGFMLYSQEGSHYITVTFNNDAGNAEFTQASAAHSIGPNGETYYSSGLSLTVPVGENFTETATISVTVNEFKADDHGNTTQEATILQTDNVDVAGQIDYAGDIDMFKVTTTETDKLVLRVCHLAFDMQPRIRVLGADGVTVVGEFDFVPQADEYFFTVLDVMAGAILSGYP